MKIHLSLSAVTEMESQLGTAGEGVLIGTAEAGSVEVTRSVAATARRPLREILCDFEEHQIVGYYRIGRDESLNLSAQDIETAKLHFAKPRHVFLRVQPASAGPANATFFFWDRGRLLGDLVLLEFPFDSTLLSAAERWPAASATPDLTGLEPGGMPELQPAVRRPGAGRPEPKWRFPVACLALLLFGFSISYLASLLFLERPVPKRSLALDAERVGADVYVRWDRLKTSALMATSGVLSLSEGATTRTIPLDAPLLRTGEVIVPSVLGDLRITLQVFSKSGTLTEVLLSSRVDPAVHGAGGSVGAGLGARSSAHPRPDGGQTGFLEGLTYTQPLLTLVLALLIGGIVRMKLKNKRDLLWAAVALLAVLAWPPLEWVFSRPLESPYHAGPVDPPAGVGAIVVLGSSIEAPNVLRPYALPDRSTYARCETAAWMQRKHPSLPVLASGGGFGEAPAVADVMRDLLVRGGVPESMVWLEDRSHSTYENATYSADILRRRGIREIVLVVDARSMTRAAACFRKQGLAVVPAPSEWRYWGGWNENLLLDAHTILKNELTLHELMGVAWYALKGRI